MKKNKGGRPTVMTEETLKKLREGFAISLTDEECCLYAGITPTTLYTYCERNPAYKEYKETLKKSPNINAKKNWDNKIREGDYQASKERLERKSRNEFSLKSETEHSGEIKTGVVILPSKE